MMIHYAFAIVFTLLCVLMCYQESKKRKIKFGWALLLLVFLTPIIGYFVIISRPLRKAKGCNWCGNPLNEAEYCGICGKNELGLTK